jgi:LacI family transcriptional regulator
MVDQTSKSDRPVAAAPRARRVLLAMDYYLHQVHAGVVDYARRAGWILDARAQHLRQLPVGWSADGVLTFIGSNDEFGPALRASKLPMVNMSPWGAKFSIPSVQLDNHQAGQLAADHLMGRGFRQLAMVQFSPTSLTSNARFQGFKSTVLKAGRDFHTLVCPLDEQQGAAPTQMIEWSREQIRRLPRPLGVFTEGDLWAVELIHICQQLGLRVPEDVAVIGIDNDPMVVDVAPVAVTSVDNNLHGLGFQAAELLDKILSGNQPPGEPILVAPRGVVQRQSTNVLAVDNEDVASAIAFIQARYREPITVADVARASHISRRRLQDLFFQHVGRTLAEEITRNRMELAKRMLFESPMKISLIAEHCGLGSGVRLSRLFARELKITPKEYRNRNTQNRSHG